jgi:hypothetical protein
LEGEKRRKREIEMKRERERERERIVKKEKKLTHLSIYGASLH